MYIQRLCNKHLWRPLEVKSLKEKKEKTTETFYWLGKPGEEVAMWSRHNKESSPSKSKAKLKHSIKY